ncbi:MAG: hypothetical protein LBL95_08925 [Deltaproteobacteria bacterium]|jgi:hypothetical protein|nr:hypothetical protein [Deltaproteobacteria bacterium]
MPNRLAVVLAAILSLALAPDVLFAQDGPLTEKEVQAYSLILSYPERSGEILAEFGISEGRIRSVDDVIMFIALRKSGGARGRELQNSPSGPDEGPMVTASDVSLFEKYESQMEGAFKGDIRD